MSDIEWPGDYLPGMTDNFVSNEVVVTGVELAKVWSYLCDTRAWPKYYQNASEIRFYNDAGPQLTAGARFRFTTFGFPVEAEVVEFVAPDANHPGRVAWHGWVEGDSEGRLDVHHAWLLESLPGDRLRVLTQETQNGAPARELAATLPNPMLNAHQDWLNGLIQATKSQLNVTG